MYYLKWSAFAEILSDKSATDSEESYTTVIRIVQIVMQVTAPMVTVRSESQERDQGVACIGRDKIPFMVESEIRKT